MPQTSYYRPIVQSDRCQPVGAVDLVGGPLWFSQVEEIGRAGSSRLIAANRVPPDVLEKLCAKRAPLLGLDLRQPRLMGVLNVTPDSFSDGGRFDNADTALTQGRGLIEDGADLLDIGGESTRPGADFVETGEEIRRTSPVIEMLLGGGAKTPISIDTRKSEVARSALISGAVMVNDVTALEYDAALAELVSASNVPVCLMHTKGDPKTMQDAPRYDSVLLDVFDYLAKRIAFCESLGIDRARIVIDPGIGFGKTVDHNLELIRGLSLFHGLGCPILLGVSRKSLIGAVGQEPQADRRLPGSIAVALEGLRQGVQILRVHDIRETRQALLSWQAAVFV